MRALIKNYRRHKALYWVFFLVMAYVILFSYIPMAGLVMAFQNFKVAKGFLGSSFVGLANFEKFFSSNYCMRLIRNTLILGCCDLIFCFPSSIVLAFLLNEVRNAAFKKTVQTITYMPYFISMVVICGLIRSFTSSDGFITEIVNAFGGQYSNLLSAPETFRPIFIGSSIWQEIGFGSVVYLAALSGVDQELYDAARIDGAGYMQQWFHVTLPGIAATIIVMLILRVGRILNVNFEKVILLYSTSTYETADVISSFVYRTGLEKGNYSYSAAVGLFNSLISLLLVLATNRISRRVTEVSLF